MLCLVFTLKTGSAWLCMVLGIEPRTQCVLVKNCPLELHLLSLSLTYLFVFGKYL